MHPSFTANFNRTLKDTRAFIKYVQAKQASGFYKLEAAEKEAQSKQPPTAESMRQELNVLMQQWQTLPDDDPAKADLGQKITQLQQSLSSTQMQEMMTQWSSMLFGGGLGNALGTGLGNSFGTGFGNGLGNPFSSLLGNMFGQSPLMGGAPNALMPTYSGFNSPFNNLGYGSGFWPGYGGGFGNMGAINPYFGNAGWGNSDLSWLGYPGGYTAFNNLF